jgi:hypothetical protein
MMSESEPTGVEPESPVEPSEPFESQPRAVAVPGKGCSRMAFAGCGLTALVLALGMLVLIMYASDIASWGLGKIRSEIEGSLPADLLPADRDRFDAAFDAVIDKVKRGDLDPRRLPGLQAELERFAKRAGNPSRQDVIAVIKALEEFVGIGGEGRDGPAEEVEETTEGVST